MNVPHHLFLNARLYTWCTSGSCCWSVWCKHVAHELYFTDLHVLPVGSLYFFFDNFHFCCYRFMGLCPRKIRGSVHFLRLFPLLTSGVKDYSSGKIVCWKHVAHKISLTSLKHTYNVHKLKIITIVHNHEKLLVGQSWS